MDFLVGFFVLSGCSIGVQVAMLFYRLWRIRRLQRELLCIAVCRQDWTFHGPMYNRNGPCRRKCC